MPKTASTPTTTKARVDVPLRTRPARTYSHREVVDLCAHVSDRLNDHRTLHDFLVALSLLCELNEDSRDDSALWAGLTRIVEKYQVEEDDALSKEVKSLYDRALDTYNVSGEAAVDEAEMAAEAGNRCHSERGA